MPVFDKIRVGLCVSLLLDQTLERCSQQIGFLQLHWNLRWQVRSQMPQFPARLVGC